MLMLTPARHCLFGGQIIRKTVTYGGEKIAPIFKKVKSHRFVDVHI